MKSLLKLLASNIGRMLRGVLGVGLLYLGAIALDGPSQVLVIIIALLLYFGALFDFCVFGLLTRSGIRGAKIRKDKNSREAVIVTVAILIFGIITFGALGYVVKNKLVLNVSGIDVQTTNGEVSVVPTNTNENAAESNKKYQNDLLLYLIEEEKLAHDVYTVMYQTYGANVFGNILQSEEKHQDRVLALLQARNISDPRSAEIGKFNNKDLQSLYDQLIAQGKQSKTEAYKVGVAIEEKDIADITNQLASATDSDIVSTLEDLRSGSENHLRSFNRQLGNY